MLESTYIFLIILVIILYIQHRNKMMWMKQYLESKKQKENTEMLELAKRFIEKECIIYTFNSQLTGIIKEVSEGAIMLENNNTMEAVNLDFVMRIREYPRKKNGKKKSVIVD